MHSYVFVVCGVFVCVCVWCFVLVWFSLMQHKLKRLKDIVKQKNKAIQQLNEREENLFYLAGRDVLTCKFHFKDGFFPLSYHITNSFPTQTKRTRKQIK